MLAGLDTPPRLAVRPTIDIPGGLPPTSIRRRAQREGGIPGINARRLLVFVTIDWRQNPLLSLG
jgi:hypothetical protein